MSSSLLLVRHRAFIAIILLLCGSLLAACGFSLRNSNAVTSSFQELQLLSAQPNSELTRLLQRNLENGGVAVTQTDDPVSQTIPTLILGPEQFGTRPLSVNPRARAAQYAVSLTVEFGVTEGESEIIPIMTLAVERSYFEDTSNIAGTQEELELITTEMRRELINRIVLRLQNP